MIPDPRLTALMREAIEESKNSVPEDAGIHPKVGAILCDETGQIIAKAHRGELGPGNHAEYCILEKAKKAGVEMSRCALFVTLEPCMSRSETKTPCAQRILDSGLRALYLGMLDPNPVICGRGEVFLRKHIRVERFPNDLVKEIEIVNSDFNALYHSSVLPNNSLYVSKQISELIRDSMGRSGWSVEHIPNDWNLTIDDLLNWCQSASRGGWTDERKANLLEARRTAYDNKYFSYTYENDVRSLDTSWKTSILGILDSMNLADWESRPVVNVGIGNGLEGAGFFENLKKLTIVDFAARSLQRAKELLPDATAIHADAEDLPIDSESQDLYMSLRTYQSSYFGLDRAVREANRVTKRSGVVVISIANGFLGDKRALVPGLVIPGTKVVDRNRPFEIAEQVRRKLTTLSFERVGIVTGLSEIFVYGRRGL